MEKPESYIQQLVKYIKKNIEKGYTTDSLRWALINQGYTRVEVQKAIDIANKELAMAVPKLREKPVINVQREPVYTEEKKEGKIKGLFSRFFGK